MKGPLLEIIFRRHAAIGMLHVDHIVLVTVIVRSLTSGMCLATLYGAGWGTSVVATQFAEQPPGVHYFLLAGASPYQPRCGLLLQHRSLRWVDLAHLNRSRTWQCLGRTTIALP